MKSAITLVILSIICLFSCQKANLNEDENVATASSVASIANDDNRNMDQGTSIVFIAGFDEDDNIYYANASTHFKQQGYFVVQGLYSLNEIVEYLDLHQSGKSYAKIHIVSHSNPWRGMSLKTIKDGERITAKSLDTYLKTHKRRLIKGISNDTNIIFHSCGLGENTALLTQLKKVFHQSTQPQLIASSYFNVFGGKYAAHYLAKPYYVFYPTGQSKGPLALSKEIATDHPDKQINWREALAIREEPALGEVYSYRFNIPVTWDIKFTNTSEMPQLETPDDIMDFIAEDETMATTLFEMKIPLEKYRWTIKVKENVLKISGKTTALCVLEPVMNLEDVGNYATLNISDKKLYTNR